MLLIIRTIAPGLSVRLQREPLGGRMLDIRLLWLQFCLAYGQAETDWVRKHSESHRLRALDDPEFDGTDFAHPAWWRGHDDTVASMSERVSRILDGLDDGRGTANEPWQSVRTRLRYKLNETKS